MRVLDEYLGSPALARLYCRSASQGTRLRVYWDFLPSARAFSRSGRSFVIPARRKL